MTTPVTLNISLDRNEAEFLAKCVASGRWQSSSEVVRSALHLLEHEQTARANEVAHARELIQEGAAQLDSGNTLEAEQFFAEWDEELAEPESRGARSLAQDQCAWKK